MIVFENISFKNLLSYGNATTSVSLNSSKNTLIIGKNGGGKSTILEAICYALYGKAYRSIKLPQLINSINTKGLLTEIEFSVGSIKYKVRRGMKPSVFEIYRDGVLVEQEAATKDYQGYLEKQILKINYKTFCQVVILGTASFVPFMQLSAGARRDVIEDVLDISVFTDMNIILKSRISTTKEELLLVNTQIESAKKDTISQQRVIKLLEEAKESRIAEETAEIELIRASIAEKKKDRAIVSKEIEDLCRDKPNISDPKDIALATKIVNRLEDELSRTEKRVKSVDALVECPTCLQEVGKEHKHRITEESVESIARIKEDLLGAKESLSRFECASKLYSTFQKSVESKTVLLNSIESEMYSFDKDIKKREAIIEKINSNAIDISSEQDKLKSIAKEAVRLMARKTELLEEKELQDISLSLLKDSGIKAAIIKEYVPILNKLINRYLGIFGFFVEFTLDENFDEKILSRGRDDFSYSSFSEGEKRRIDLSILFAFRQISEMKNSADCNLLFCDEVADGNFDVIAREAFLEILNGVEGGNNFVVSHGNPAFEDYNSVIEVTKKNDFSTLEFLT